jgi:hypothetical protein
VIFSAPDTKVTRAAQLDGRAQRAQDAPPRVRRLCAITQAWLHRGDASEVSSREQPKTAPPAVYCSPEPFLRRGRSIYEDEDERPEGLLVICFQNGCHRRAAKREVDSYDREAEAYCIESVSRSSRRLADLGDGVSAYAAAAAQTRGYDPNRPETSGTVAQGELNSFALEQGDGSRE